MSERDFKSITEVTTVDNLPEGANVIINDGGVAKQVSLEKLISDIMAKEQFVVNITITPNNSNSASYSADKTYQELKESYDSGKDIIFIINDLATASFWRTRRYMYAKVHSNIDGDNAMNDVIGFFVEDLSGWISILFSEKYLGDYMR